MFPAMPTTVKPPRGPSHAENVRYSSDESSSESDSESKSDSNVDDESSKLMPQHQSVAPPRKRQQREVPYRIERLERKKKCQAGFEDALKDLQKLLKSKKTRFVAGPSHSCYENSLVTCHCKWTAFN
jgi:hypothetical protein